MEVSGFIPKEVIIYSKPETEITIQDGTKISVLPSFIFDSSDKNKFARMQNMIGVNGNYEKLENNINNLKLISLYNGYYGGYYKIIDSQNRMFDIPSQSIVDSIFISGIRKNGKLPGSYVWATHNSTTKLIKTKSELHKALIRATKRKSFKKIAPSKLKKNHIYINRMGKEYIYMGEVNTLSLQYREDISVLKNRQYVKYKLFYYYNDLLEPLESITESLKNEYKLTRFRLIKYPNLIEEGKKIDLGNDLVSKIRKISLSETLKHYNERKNIWILSGRSELCHMHSVDEDIPETPEYIKLIGIL